MDAFPTPAHPLPRRTVVLGASAVALAATSCASYGSGAAPAAEPATSATTEAREAQEPLAKTSAVPVGGGTVFAEAKTVVVQPTAGDFKAFSAVCTHQGCLVTEVTTTINCPCHGSSFALADGSVTNGPATAPLPAKQVTVNGDDLVVSG